MIILHLILHSAVHIYDFHIIQNFNPACAGRFLREENKPKPSLALFLLTRHHSLTFSRRIYDNRTSWQLSATQLNLIRHTTKLNR